MAINMLSGDKMELSGLIFSVLGRTDLEFHFLRTMPRSKVPRNLKMRVCRVATDWELPQPDVFPLSCRIPQSIVSMDAQPPINPRQALLLTINFDQIPVTRFLGGTTRSAQANLSVDWRSTFSADSLLVRRDADLNADFYVQSRDHRIMWSHMGLRQRVQITKSVKKFLDKQAQIISMSVLDQPERPFRLRFDEITRLLVVEQFAIGGQKPISRGAFFCSKMYENRPAEKVSRFYYQDGERHHQSSGRDWADLMTLHHYDEPDLAVYFYMCNLIKKGKGVNECGLLDLLNQVIASVRIWTQIYQGTSDVPQDVRLDEVLTPWESLLNWVIPICQLFFEPVIGYLKKWNKALLRAPVTSGDSRRNKKFPVSPTTWKSGMDFFDKMVGLTKVLEAANTSRNLCPLFAFWDAREQVDLSRFAFISKNIINNIRNVFFDQEDMSVFASQMKREMKSFEGRNLERLKQCENINHMEISHSNQHYLHQLISTLVRIDPIDTDDTLSSRVNQDWVVAKTVGPRSQLRVSFDDARCCWSTCVVQAVRYRSLLIVITADRKDKGKIIEANIIDQDKRCRSHTFYRQEDYLCGLPQDDLGLYTPVDVEKFVGRCSAREHRYHEWSDGLLVWVRPSEEALVVISAMDFRRCWTDPDAPPLVSDLMVTKGMVGIGGLKFRDHNDCWTVGLGTVSIVGFVASAPPLIFTWTVTSAGIGSPQIVDWVSHLVQAEQEELMSLDPTGEYLHRAHIICASKSKTLFLMLLQPEDMNTLPTDGSERKDLWIVCFRWSSTQRQWIFATKLVHKVGVNYYLNMWKRDEEVHPLAAKVVHCGNQDFLLVSVGTRPTEVFTLMGNRLRKIRINSETSTRFPELPGQQIRLAGLLTSYFLPYSIIERRDLKTLKPIIDIYALRLKC